MGRHRRNARAILCAMSMPADAGAIDVSALAPAGTEADVVARLFWLMAGGALAVWLAVLAVALFALLRPGPRDRRSGRALIVAGGVVAPTLVLGALLLHGLVLMPRLRAPPPGEAPSGAGPRIIVTGEQWWWRVRYAGFEGIGDVVLANEIHLPVGERVRLVLDSPDVIHALWIPSLAGKIDMIPGRTTTLVLEPTRAGTFRGVCAEYCGTSHAHMRFLAVVKGRADFERWLRAQAAPAAAPRTALQRQGRDAFLRNGCGACHAVRGTPAGGTVGPDLTHVGSRLEIAAGALPNDAEALQRWIARPHATKPEALMPDFEMLPPTEIRAIAAWLGGLK